MNTAASTQQESIRTTVLMHQMACRIGTPDHQQFASAYDVAFPDMCSTLASRKWRAYFEGEKGKRPLKPELLENFCALWAEAGQLYRDGPSDLWLAMWGDERKLWRLCRTRCVANGPDYDDHLWRAIESVFTERTTFGEALREFEGSVLMAEAYNHSLSIRYLTEAIAFYRLHRFMNGAAPLDVDGKGAYRCVRICLDNQGVRWALDSLTFGISNIYGLLVNELAVIEAGRLVHERSYRGTIAVDDLAAYVAHPQAVISDDERWIALNFNWAPT